MAQFVQLQSHLQAFQNAGIGVVALTYDEPALQQAFVDENDIGYAFISDVDAYTVKALDILNEKNKPGDGAYGIPHPGIFIVSRDLKIVGKIFVHGYKTRVSAKSVLARAKELLN